MEHWECQDTSDVKESFGMQINQKAQQVEIDQITYLKQILVWFDMQNAKTIPTPLPTGYNPETNTDIVDPEC